jgi:hypothetical protein
VAWCASQRRPSCDTRALCQCSTSVFDQIDSVLTLCERQDELAADAATAEAAERARKMQEARQALQSFRCAQVEAEATTAGRLSGMSEDAYLQEVVTSELRAALLELASVRPADPLAFLVRGLTGSR